MRHFEREGDCYYEGYWQSIHYFTEIKTELQVEVFMHPIPNGYNAGLIKKIEQAESVGLHVRRGLSERTRVPWYL